MKIVVDDIIFSLQSIGGISVYWREILNKANNENEKQKFTLLHVSHYSSVLFKDLLWKKKIINDLNLPLIILRLFPLMKKIPSYSIFHSSYLRVSWQKKVCNIVTIHDLAAELGVVKGLKSGFKKLLQHNAVNKADGIICVSDTTRSKLLEYYKDIPAQKVKTIYHGCSDSFFPLPEIQNQTSKNIVFVGSRNGYKNFRTLIKVLELLPTYELIIVGGGDLKKDELLFINQRIGSRYIHLLNINSDQLNDVYNDSFCLVYPSSYEGFGMPVIEAMKAGCPVITTKVEALLEVSGKASLLIENPFDINEYIEAIEQLENKEKREAYISKGILHAKKFSWDKNYKEMIAFYNEVYYRKFKNSIN